MQNKVIVVAKIKKEQQNSTYALYILVCLRTYCYLIFFRYIKWGIFPQYGKKVMDFDTMLLLRKHEFTLFPTAN